MPIKSRHIFLSHAFADVVRYYTKALKRYFSEEPAGEPIELDVGKLGEQLPHILAALGQRAQIMIYPNQPKLKTNPLQNYYSSSPSPRSPATRMAKKF